MLSWLWRSAGEGDEAWSVVWFLFFVLLRKRRESLLECLGRGIRSAVPYWLDRIDLA